MHSLSKLLCNVVWKEALKSPEEKNDDAMMSLGGLGLETANF